MFFAASLHDVHTRRRHIVSTGWRKLKITPISSVPKLLSGADAGDADVRCFINRLLVLELVARGMMTLVIGDDKCIRRNVF